MKKFATKSAACATKLLLITATVFASGCVSGGWKTTRNYASFVNSKPIYGRIPLYIISAPGWIILALIDVFPFVGRNAFDFWNGTVTAGTSKFSDSTNEYVATHEVLPESGLRQSTFDIIEKTTKVHQSVVIKELANGKVEIYRNGKLETTMDSVSELSAVLASETGLSVSQN